MLRVMTTNDDIGVGGAVSMMYETDVAVDGECSIGRQRQHDSRQRQKESLQQQQGQDHAVVVIVI